MIKKMSTLSVLGLLMTASAQAAAIPDCWALHPNLKQGQVGYTVEMELERIAPSDLGRALTSLNHGVFFRSQMSTYDTNPLESDGGQTVSYAVLPQYNVLIDHGLSVTRIRQGVMASLQQIANISPVIQVRCADPLSPELNF